MRYPRPQFNGTTIINHPSWGLLDIITYNYLVLILSLLNFPFFSYKWISFVTFEFDRNTILILYQFANKNTFCLTARMTLLFKRLPHRLLLCEVLWVQTPMKQHFFQFLLYLRFWEFFVSVFLMYVRFPVTEDYSWVAFLKL